MVRAALFFLLITGSMAMADSAVSKAAVEHLTCLEGNIDSSQGYPEHCVEARVSECAERLGLTEDFLRRCDHALLPALEKLIDQRYPLDPQQDGLARLKRLMLENVRNRSLSACRLQTATLSGSRDVELPLHLAEVEPDPSCMVNNLSDAYWAIFVTNKGTW